MQVSESFLKNGGTDCLKAGAAVFIVWHHGLHAGENGQSQRNNEGNKGKDETGRGAVESDCAEGQGCRGFSAGIIRRCHKVLPEAGALESARSYREKKAVPLYKTIIGVLRALYNKYLDLISSFNRLRGDYNRLQQRYDTLDASFDRLADENDRLIAIEADYNALCRGYGADRVEEQVRAIREREAEQKRHRQIQQQRHSIGVR